MWLSDLDSDDMIMEGHTFVAAFRLKLLKVFKLLLFRQVARGKHTAKTTTHVATSHRRRSARQELDISLPLRHGRGWLASTPLVLEPAAAAPEPSAAA